jgi:hypothetical protein
MKDELENIDDNFLKNIGNKGDFCVPENYFNQTKLSIINKINVEPNFKINNNESGYTVPNNYFETNKHQILSKINNKITFKAKVITFANWQLMSGIAAIFIAIISLIVFIKTDKTENLSANLNNLSEADMIDYLANNEVKIEWINELNADIKTVSKKDDNNKEIEQYLLEHADEQALLDEL